MVQNAALQIICSTYDISICKYCRSSSSIHHLEGACTVIARCPTLRTGYSVKGASGAFHVTFLPIFKFVHHIILVFIIDVTRCVVYQPVDSSIDLALSVLYNIIPGTM